MLTWLILHTLTALALAGVALALGRWLRLWPAARHALWLVVLLKLLTPPVVSWPWTLPLGIDRLPTEAEPASEVDAPTDPRPAIMMAELGDRRVSPSRERMMLSSEGPQEAVVRGVPGVQDHQAQLTGLAVAAWLACGVFLAAWELARARRLCRLLAHTRPIPPDLAATVRELAENLGLRLPRIVVLPALGSPVVWAWGKTCLLWPAGLEEGLSNQALRAVLIHELAHLRRRDHWVGWLLLMAGCVWWWHPLFWLVRRRLHCEAELACDAWVVATLPQARRAYAEALLTVCQRWSLPAAAVSALGAAGQRRDLERRLIMVMREQVPYRLSMSVILGVGALALGALPALTSGQAAPSSGPIKPGTAPQSVRVVEVETTAAPDEKERKIKELEDKVQALLAELRALRGERKVSVAPVLVGTVDVTPGARYVTTQAGRPVAVYGVDEGRQRTVVQTGGAVSEVTLTRATYKLKGPQAESLGKFLSENVKASVMETKVEGENLIVTTTPEVQHVVTQIIALIQGRPLHGGVYYYATPAKR